ncbi:MAG: histidine phosphatase family protein [Pseudomonadota bacterium]
MTKIYVIAHTEATHHVDGLIGGWFDSVLTEQGHRQAQEIAQAIRALVSNTVPVYSSDLKRALQTAEPIAQVFKAKIHSTPDLREIGCGIADGKAHQWFNEHIIYPPRDASRIDHEIIEGAETRREAATRIDRFVQQLIQQTPEEAIVVTHGFAITFIIAAWIGMPITATGFVGFDMSAGSITTLEMHEPWGNRLVTKLNDTNHLTSLSAKDQASSSRLAYRAPAG